MRSRWIGTFTLFIGPIPYTATECGFVVQSFIVGAGLYKQPTLFAQRCYEKHLELSMNETS